MGKKVLILGAGGFIGSHLVSELLKNKKYIMKYIITAVDIQNKKLNEIVQCKKCFKYIHLDITKERKKLSSLIQKNDIIVNLIAIANPGVYVKDPIYTFKLDFMESFNIVEECVKHKKRLIQFSTSEVYGKSASVYMKNRKFLFNEDTTNLILGPVSKQRWIYSCSKQLLERIIYAYGISGKLNYTIVRPFNYMGPLIDFLPSEEKGCPRVFSFFMDALLYKKPMYLVNEGKARRCYTYIKDATAAHLKIIENKGNRFNRQIINIGNIKNETTVRNFAKTMLDIYKKEFAKKGEKLPSMKNISGEKFYGKGYDDSDRRLPDLEKIRMLSGWKAKYSLREMLYETMKYYVNKHRK